MIYKRGGGELALESVSFDGGRINKTSNTYEISYFITDHLGSVRATVNQHGVRTSTNNYYPYGLSWNDPSTLISNNRWLYNGQELQTVGFPEIAGILDYGWRMYDPRIGRMKTIDLLAEFFEDWSPFSYALNNPIAYIDLYGLSAQKPEEKEESEPVVLDTIVVPATQKTNIRDTFWYDIIPVWSLYELGVKAENEGRYFDEFVMQF